MRPIYLCGVRLELSGDVPDSLWTDEVRPFEVEAPYRCSHTLNFVRDPDHEKPTCVENRFSYRRHDLSFTGHGTRSEVRHDGGQAAALAGLELALSQAVRELGGCLLHASAGTIGSDCWLMPGPSGTGKSTAARGGFDRVLSDERVAVMPDSSGAYQVWSTPFWSDGRTLNVSVGSAPLTVLALLRKGERARHYAADRARMAAWLMRSVVLYDVAEAAQLKALELACSIAESVQCVELEFPKEGQWVPSLMNPIGLAS